LPLRRMVFACQRRRRLGYRRERDWSLSHRRLGRFGRSGPNYSTTEVAYVSEVSGRVVAPMQGRPTSLDALDVVADQTRIDLQANSELRICHSRTHQVFTLKGPLTAMIEQGGVTIENGRIAVASTGSCAAPTASVFHAVLLLGARPPDGEREHSAALRYAGADATFAATASNR
jgi:hypothetical protein